MTFFGIFCLAISSNYRIGLTHAFQIGMQGVLIKMAVNGMGQGQRLWAGRLLNQTIVLSHLWDDLGDDADVLKEYPGLRLKVGDLLLLFDGSNAGRVFAEVLEQLLSQEVKPPLLPGWAVATLRKLEDVNAKSPEKANWVRLSLLRLLASGMAQTEFLIDQSRYKPMVEAVRRMSLSLAANSELKEIIAEARSEFLLGTLASGSQELFPLAVPGLHISQDDIDVLTAANMFLGAPICFDKSLEQRSKEGIAMPPEDLVSANELALYLGRAARVMNKMLKDWPDGPTIKAYLKMIRRTHWFLSIPSPFGYAQIDKVRPGRDGQPGFGTALQGAFRMLHR